MSTHTIPEHQAVYFTCDARPAATVCRAGESVRLDQTALFIDPAQVRPEGWTRRGGADLCPEHRDVERVVSITWNTTAGSTGQEP